MVNILPQFLTYSFFVPTLLRIAVACAFGYQVIFHFKQKRAVATEIHQKFRFLSNETAVWATGLLILAELALGILLFVGAWTQVAAILAALGFLKMAYFNDTLPAYAPLPRSTYVVLIAVALSLIVSGAGAFAFDLPL